MARTGEQGWMDVVARVHHAVRVLYYYVRTAHHCTNLPIALVSWPSEDTYR